MDRLLFSKQMNKIISICFVFYLSLITIKAQDTSKVSKAYFTIDSSRKPLFCFNKILEENYTYRWGFYHSENISITKGKFIENTDKLTGYNGKNNCHDYRDSLGTYWVCLESTDKYNNKDTFCQILINDFSTDAGYKPNIFTPGIDSTTGKPKTFNIAVENEIYYYLVIYNRFGVKVFETLDKNVQWNGNEMNTGNPCPDGTYYYLLQFTYNDEKKEKLNLNGNVRVIR